MEKKYINDNWIAEFREKNKRKPRILHIGNIANNAYQNAKMLNRIGADCDVICFDYYHAMGCPEWDEMRGDIDTDVFHPSWKKADLGRYRRQKWFAQGKFKTCRDYLIARRENKKVLELILWKKLQFEREIFAFFHRPSWGIDPENFFYHLNYRLYMLLDRIIVIFKRIFGIFSCVNQKNLDLLKNNKKIFLLKAIYYLTGGQYGKKKINYKLSLTYEKEINKLNVQLKELFPDKKVKLHALTDSYIIWSQAWVSLFKHYDIVEAYADTCIYPFLAGYYNYIAFEHGTIRDFPNEDNEKNNLMCLAYSAAKAIYVTNVDCYKSALYLKNGDSENIICGLHGIDVKNIVKKLHNNRKHVNDGYKNMIFWPSRHDYSEELCGYLKGDEWVVEAATQLCNKEEEFTIVTVKMGNDWERVRKLISENPKLEKHFIWIDQVPKTILYNYMYESLLVIDQFYLKAIGALAIEALSIGGGTLITSKMNEEEWGHFFLRELPTYTCSTKEELYMVIENAIRDNADAKKRSDLGKQWIAECHSKTCIIQKQCAAFKLVM